MKKTGLLILLAVFSATLILSWVAVSAQDAPSIIGVDKCKTCHKSEKKGNQYQKWLDSKHSGAFATLANEASLALAKEKGIEDPQKAEECLYCHTTAAFLKAPLDAAGKYTDAEGVGCEACHGAGSLYKSMKVMKDLEQATANGLLAVTEETCTKCHNENSPTFKGFDYAARSAEVAHPYPAAE